MLEHYFCRSQVIKRINESPHSEAIKDYISFLGGRGHSGNSIQAYTQAVEHFFHWLNQQGRASLGCDSVQEYLFTHLLDCSCPPPSPCYLITNRAALRQLLRSANLPLKSRSPVDSQKERLIAEYDKYLLETAGLAPVTRRCRTRHAREFLEKTFPSRRQLRFDRISPTDITNFVAERSVDLKPASKKTITYSLRSLFRFL